MDYLISYNEKDEVAVKEAHKIMAALKGKADNLTGVSNRSARLDEADFLIVIFNGESDFTDKQIDSDWRYFLSEIKWKRKPYGDIVLIVPPTLNFAKLPFLLKDSYYFNYNEYGQLAMFMADASKKYEAAKNKSETKIVPREIKYVPHENAVKQITFSARAPGVDSFDGAINYQRSEDSGCKDDHVFSGKKAGKDTSFIEEELQRPTLISKNSTNAKNAPRPKKTTAGCVVSIFMAILIISIFAVVVAVIFNQLGTFSLQSGMFLGEIPQSAPFSGFSIKCNSVLNNFTNICNLW